MAEPCQLLSGQSRYLVNQRTLKPAILILLSLSRELGRSTAIVRHSKFLAHRARPLKGIPKVKPSALADDSFQP